MSDKYILKEDFVIPAGAIFSKGPYKREYGGDNYEAAIEISPDATADFTIYLSDDNTLDLLEKCV